MSAAPARAAAAVILLIAAVLAACGKGQGGIDGRAVAAGKAVPGASAEAYLSGERGAAASPFATAAAGPDGRFGLDLPAGRYWIWVKDLGATAGPRRVAEHAGNPVTVSAGRRAAIGDVELRAIAVGSYYLFLSMSLRLAKGLCVAAAFFSAPIFTS